MPESTENKKEVSPDIQNKITELVHGGKHDEAIFILDKLIKDDPQDYKTLGAKARVLSQTKKYKEAVEVADEALKINKDELILYNKGLDLYYSKRYEEAVQVFDECLEKKPNDVELIMKKILALGYADRHQESVDLFRLSDLPESKKSTIYNNIGYSCLCVKEYTDAEKYLLKAKLIQESSEDNEIDYYIYGNLLQVYLEQKKYLKFIILRLQLLFLPITRKTNINLPRKTSENYIFKGPGSLFTSDSQYRETLAIWKLFRTPFFWNFCNGTFRWFAVNIPLDLIDNNNPQGDIDLLVSMPVGGPPDANTPIKHRAFEIKSMLINKEGKVKSLKSGKHNKIYSQLKKLDKFGCEQIFLLELYVIERGFSNRHNFPPQEIIDEINKKIQKFKDDNFGYVMVGHEPSPYAHEELGGINHMPMNIMPTKDNQAKQPFNDLVKYIDDFHNREINNFSSPGKFVVISYCKHCKELIMLHSDDTTFLCPKCNKVII